MQRSVKTINKLIEVFRTRLIRIYGSGLVFFDVNIQNSDRKVVLGGLVGTTKLKDKFLKIINRKKIEVTDNIKVLSDPKDHLEIGWGKSLNDQNIYRFPDKLPKFSTHLLNNETFRILKKIDNWILVQLEDLSVGWISCNGNHSIKIVFNKNKPDYQKYSFLWRQVPRSGFRKLSFIFSSEELLDKKLREIYSIYIDMPYVFGGRSPRIGFDCSGLIQNVFFKLEGILLPKNSLDQIVLGKTVNIKKFDKNNLKIGDLIFIRIRKKIPHSGIVTSRGILHAEGLNQKKVLIDSFSDIKDPSNFAHQWIRDYGKVIRFFVFKSN